MDDSAPGVRRRSWVTATLLGACIALTLGACSDAPDERPPPSSESPAPSAPPASPGADHPMVVVVSVDGLNPDALTRLGPDELPGFTRLTTEGASTLNARSAVEETRTLPNHTGMLTGRGVAGEQGHGVTFNDDDGRTLAEVHGSYVPGIFDLAHDHGLRTAFFAEKDKVDLLLRSWDAVHGAPDTTGADDGRDKTDIQRIGKPVDVLEAVTQTLADQQPDLTFLHLAGPDVAGHATGWLGPSYLDAVRAVDDDLVRLLARIDAEPALAGRVTIVLTADHGGRDGQLQHGDATDPADYRVPFIAWGRGVEAGTDLYALNPGRTDPGAGRPDYSGAQPVRNLDVAGTVLSLLSLPDLAGTTSSAWPTVALR